MPKTADELSEIAQNMRMFTGSQTLSMIGLSKDLLTEGTMYVALELEAFWLFDAISSHAHNFKGDEPFIVAKLTVDGNTADLTLTDGNYNVLAEQAIPYTDFPMYQILTYACFDKDLGGYVHMLPSEY